jgi:hypothetical protein
MNNNKKKVKIFDVSPREQEEEHQHHNNKRSERSRIREAIHHQEDSCHRRRLAPYLNTVGILKDFVHKVVVPVYIIKAVPLSLVFQSGGF